MGDRVHPIHGDGVHSPSSASVRSNSGEFPATSLPMDMSEKRESNYDKEQERRLLNQLPKDYIYNIPEPLPRDHPSYRSRPSRRRCSPCCYFFAWFVGIIVTILFLLGITALVLYLVLQPKAPSFSVTDASTSLFNLSTQPLQSAPSSGAFAYLNADVTFTVEAQNPNKKIGIYYDSVDVTLYYDGTQIGNGSLPAFYQGHRNTTNLELEMKGQDVPLSTSIGQALQQSVTDQSNLSLQVITVTKVRVKVGGWSSGASTFQVKCDVQISNPLAGNVQLISKSCKLKVKSFKL